MAHGSLYLNSHLWSDGVKCSPNFVAFIKCDQNYSLTGFGYARCMGYEKWYPSVLPVCEGITSIHEDKHITILTVLLKHLKNKELT